MQCLPQSEDILPYKEQLVANGYNYKEPLARELYNPTFVNTQISWNPREAGDYDDILPTFRLPEIFAASGNCVDSQFNANPVHPRLYAPRDQAFQVIHFDY
jgi:hypothetical protein